MGRRGVRFGVFGAAAGTLILLLTALPVGAVNPATGTTTGGQLLNVQIDSLASGAVVAPGTLAVTGRTSLGSLGAATNVLYVVDVSGSTSVPANQDCNGDGAVNAGDDLNGDGGIGQTIDCEISGVIALNASLLAVSVDVGLVQFDSSASVVDVNQAVAGTQSFTTPGADTNANGQRDIDEAARGLDSSGGTNFDDALTAMNVAFATQPAGERNIAFFLSDGEATVATGAGSPLQAAKDAGTTVKTFSVGTGAAGCDATSPLTTIATTTGDTCTAVTNPANLSAALTGSGLSGISRVDVSLDGGPAIAATLDALGNWSANVPVTAPGIHTITATAVATDATMVTADIQFEVSTGVTPVPTTTGTTPPPGGTSTSSSTSTSTTSSTTSSTVAITTTTTTGSGGLLARTGSALQPLAVFAVAAMVVGALLRFGSRATVTDGAPAVSTRPKAPEWGPAQIGKAICAALAATVIAIADRFRNNPPKH